MSDRINHPLIRIGDKLVKRANHTPPRAAIVAWCPWCLTYGGPMGETDRICGNCEKNGTRIYKEIISEEIEAQNER